MVRLRTLCSGPARASFTQKASHAPLVLSKRLPLKQAFQESLAFNTAQKSKKAKKKRKKET